MPPRHIFTRLVAGTLAVAAPTMVAAQSTQTWTVCTIGYGACSSVSLGTVTTQSGTNVSVSMHNFQGQSFLGDNVGWSSIVRLRFYDIITPVAQGITGGTALGVLSGATGNAPSYTFGSFHGPSLGIIEFQTPDWPTNGITGCNPGPYLAAVAHTCAPNSTVAFSFSTSQFWDAALIGDMTIDYMFAPVNFGGAYATSCGTNPGLSPGLGFPPACNVISDEIATSTAPEPASLLLVATGLLGVTGLATRRKRMHTA